ncbi:MAG: small multi-drug export protein [Ignisphaera sp.]
MDLVIIVQYAIIFIMSFLPISEVRGGISLSFLYFHNDFGKLALGVTASIIGNLLVAPFVLYLLKYIDAFIRNSRLVPEKIRRAYTWVIKYAERKSKSFEKYEMLGLAIFVAIPLPATGAWTASLIAFLLGMNRKKALISIEAGVLGASAIVLIACLLGLAILKKLFLIP